MGTRHVIAVKLGQEYKVAQYGLYDGYPTNVIPYIFNFIRHYNLFDFAYKVSKCKFTSKNNLSLDQCYSKTGKRILYFIASSECKETLNRIDFIEDESCDFFYELDLDKGIFTTIKNPATERKMRVITVASIQDMQDEDIIYYAQSLEI